jgi:hypothetical protein
MSAFLCSPEHDAVIARVELEARGWEAWTAAWERASASDKKRGRPYDRHRYARLAHIARRKVLGRCERKDCKECPPSLRSAP